jgi:Tfp pilus assembly protein PilF
VNLAIIQSKSGNTGVALENINKALKINPANKQANKIRQTLIK